MGHSAFDGLRQGLEKAAQLREAEARDLGHTKSMCIRNVPEWVHQDYRILKVLCQKEDPAMTMNGLLVEALREYLGVAYAKRGKTYMRENA